jgi:ATP-dependent DNA helicase RecG
MEIERIKNLVEKAGSGFLRIKRAMEKYELPMANIYFSKRLFEVSFKRPDLQINSYKRRVIDGKGFEYTRKDLQKDLNRDLQKDLIKLNKNQKRIVVEMKKNNFITQKELSKIVDITEKNIRNNIAKLKNLNIIKRIGPAKGGYWKVVEK